MLVYNPQLQFQISTAHSYQLRGYHAENQHAYTKLNIVKQKNLEDIHNMLHEITVE